MSKLKQLSLQDIEGIKTLHIKYPFVIRDLYYMDIMPNSYTRYEISLKTLSTTKYHCDKPIKVQHITIEQFIKYFTC